ncbi:MAG: hypothetical protein WC456_00270 [Patescibacteria group bacterium]
MKKIVIFSLLLLLLPACRDSQVDLEKSGIKIGGIVKSEYGNIAITDISSRAETADFSVFRLTGILYVDSIVAYTSWSSRYFNGPAWHVLNNGRSYFIRGDNGNYSYYDMDLDYARFYTIISEVRQN